MKISRLYFIFRKIPGAGLAAAGALAYGIWQAFSVMSGDWENTIVLSILGALFMFDSLEKSNPGRVSRFSRLSAWGMLVLSPLVLFTGDLLLSASASRALALVFAVDAICCFTGGIRIAFRMFPPVAYALTVLPFQEYLSLTLSYPLRLISSAISAETMTLFHAPVSYHLTTIRIGNSAIAITDACSGINQLAVLLLLAYLIIRNRHANAWFSAAHYLLLLPIIVLANSLRLVVTMSMFLIMGLPAFDDFWHFTLGCFFVATASLLLLCCGGFFPEKKGGPQ